MLHRLPEAEVDTERKRSDELGKTDAFRLHDRFHTGKASGIVRGTGHPDSFQAEGRDVPNARSNSLASLPWLRLGELHGERDPGDEGPTRHGRRSHAPSP